MLSAPSPGLFIEARTARLALSDALLIRGRAIKKGPNLRHTTAQRTLVSSWGECQLESFTELDQREPFAATSCGASVGD